jgi:predicted O-methyltransferase YrrM
MATKTIHLDDTLYPYFKSVAYEEPDVLAELRAATIATGGDAVMQITPEQGAFMAMLVRISGARRIFEIGTFTGYSTLAMALALPADGRIVASDISGEWTGIGRVHWQKAGVADRIQLRLKPGLELIDGMLRDGEAGRYDMAFIDADKPNYDGYYEGVLRLLKPGGFMLIDNVLWGGAVANPEKMDSDTAALRALNEKIRSDDRVDLAMVPIGDGVTMARKRFDSQRKPAVTMTTRRGPKFVE